MQQDRTPDVQKEPNKRNEQGTQNSNDNDKKRNKRRPKKPKHLETDTVINLSTVNLTDADVSQLSRGLNFCPTPQKIDWNEINADLAEFKRRLRLKHYFHEKTGTEDDSTDNSTHSDTDQMTKRYKKTINWTPPRNLDPSLDSYIDNVEDNIKNIQPTRISDNLTKDERTALKTLAKRTDIIIKPADKGSGTVVMDRQMYIDECNRQLNDTNFYEKHNKDITSKVTNTVKQYLQQMKRDETHRERHIQLPDSM